MTITTAQLSELTTLLNERIAEFGDVGHALPRFTPGLTRLIYGAVEEWWEADTVAEHVVREAAAEVEDVGEVDWDDEPGYDPFDMEFEQALEDDAAAAVANKSARMDAKVEIAREAHQPEPSPAAAATLGPEHVVVTPLKSNGHERLPHPDVARAKIADALANGSGGALAQAIGRPRALAEVDASEDCDEEEHDEPKQGRADKRMARLSEGEAQRKAQQRGALGSKAPTLDELCAELQRQAMGGAMPSMNNFNTAKPATWPEASSFIASSGLSWNQLAARAGLRPNKNRWTAQGTETEQAAKEPHPKGT